MSRRARVERLDYRGFGGFIPFTELEKAVRRSMRVLVYTDPKPVSELVAAWARSRGFSVRVEEAIDHAEVLIERRGGVEEVVEEAKPPIIEFSLEVSPDYDDAMAAKLANLPEVVRMVIKSPILFRGPINDPHLARIMTREAMGKLLLRLTVGGTDYLFYIEKGVVKAAARVGAPLGRREAESLLKKLVGERQILVTLYKL